MKTQKSVTFAKKNLKKKNICKVSNIELDKLEIIVNMQDIMCSLNYSLTKNIPIAFHNVSNYDHL